ncbi:MAG TPA: T9SS type A sorting domain-containing protein [Saprospiraceae bacterium]|nr:T9SS type A sorting domain-containing protein [Saprospiraceae bacterium]
MKKLLLGLGFLILYTALEAQTIKLIWGGANSASGSFQNGLNDWETVGLSSAIKDSSKNAVWMWSGQGKVNQGGYSVNLSGIESVTKDNGAAIFHSDFLDNGGDKAKLGKGSAPSPQSGALISPVISCAGRSTVLLTFTQYFRNYNAHCYLDLSVDGGANWTERLTLNEDVGIEQRTSRDDQRYINLSKYLANKSNVKFRFVFEGDYYFWAIDDVSLIEQLEYSIGIHQVQYAPPAYAQPLSQVCDQEFGFTAELFNDGSVDQTNAVLNLSVKAEDGRVVFSDRLTGIKLLKDSLSNWVSIPGKFNPKSLTVGKYYIEYILFSSGSIDFDLSDNFHKDSFEITNSKYALAPNAKFGYRGFQAEELQGCLYRTSDCWVNFDKFAAHSIQFAATAYDQTKSLTGHKVKAHLVKVLSSVPENWTGFDLSSGLSSSSVELVASGEFTFTNEKNHQSVDIPLSNAQGNKVLLDKSTRYFVFIEYAFQQNPNPETWIFQSVSPDKNYSHREFAICLIDNDGNWFSEGWPEAYVPFVNLNLEVLTKEDEVSLESNSFSLFPNPANNQIAVELNAKIEGPATLVMFDALGKVIYIESISKKEQKTFPLNISELQEGQYFIRLTSNEGSLTKSFVKAK